MPELSNDRRVFTLHEVTKSIEKTLHARYQSTFWVKAEMNKLNYYSHSGHSYPELVEKVDGKVVAQIKAHIWKRDFIKINENFLRVLKEPLKDGIKILFLAKITFDASYGLSLWILDIDPSFTLGDLEREKAEAIQTLKEERIFDKNKKLPFPLLPQRIAIISVETSKGYADFIKVLETNSWNYAFFHLLFPALLQGDQAVESITKQLARIKIVKAHFDVVVIIRGGGGDVGLSCYNHIELARQIAHFPIPVLTGIGHATNETVSEMISYKNAITPTKLAEYLIQKFHNFSVPIKEGENLLIEKSKRILEEEKIKFTSLSKLYKSATKIQLQKSHHNLSKQLQLLSIHSNTRIKKEHELYIQIKKSISGGVQIIFQSSSIGIWQNSLVLQKDVLAIIGQHHNNVISLKEQLKLRVDDNFKRRTLELLNIQKTVSILSPEQIIKRGYSITLVHGKTARWSEISNGDILETIMAEGSIKSKVIQTNPRDE